MWCEKIVNKISDTNTDVLFIIDPISMLDYPDIQKSLNTIYDTVTYQNELVLRRILRNLDQKTIIKFNEESQIPFDLYSSHATIKIGPQDIFPFLNENVLSKISLEHYQKIFTIYENEKQAIFDKLSTQETENFLNSVIFIEDIGIKERIFELNEKLTKYVHQSTLEPNAWGNISILYGELKYLIDSQNLDFGTNDIESIIQLKFKEFISNQYEDLIYDVKSPLNSNIMNMIYESTPTALICFDCMGFEEWNVIKKYLEEKLNLNFGENYSFSMLPSDTFYSRTSLYSGLLPAQIDELNIRNKNEEKLFRYSLKNNFNIKDHDVYFKRCRDPHEIPEKFAFEDYNAVGIIFSFIDELVHGKIMNKSIIISALQRYLELNRLDKLVDSLLNKGFYVYFSSDHGNIYAHGNGKRPPKDLFISRSRRYLKSNHENILREYFAEESLLIQFKDIIGEDYFLLLADNTMFNNNGTLGLTHGGISIEEVVIPFIEVKNNERL